MGRSWALEVSVAVTASACIKPSEISCGGLICPPSSVCLSNNTCVGADAVQACSGVADGGACTTAEFTGSCTDGACTAAVCGNGIVEGSEQCDGSIGAVDCVTFGFDLGVPTCNARCDLDVIDSCTRFGWERLFPVAANYAWTDGTRFVISSRDGPGDTSVYIGGAIVASTDVQPYVSGNAQRMFAWGGSGIAEYVNGASGFTDPGAPDPGDGNYLQVELAPDDSVYLMINPGCQIYRRAPGGTGWAEIRADGADDCSLIRANSGKIYAALELDDTTAEADVWAGAGETWTKAFTAPSEINDLQSAVDGTQWVADNNGFGTVDGEQLVQLNTDGANYNLAPAGDVVYISNGGLELDRYHAGHVESFDAPTAGTIQADAAGNLYEMGNGVYRYMGLEYADRLRIDQGSTALQLLPDGGAITNAQSEVLVTDFDGGWNEVNSDLSITTLSARSETDAYLTDGQSLAHFDGTLFTPVAVPTPTLAGLWEPATGPIELYVIASAGVALVYSGGTWTTLTTPAGGASCDLAGITGTSSMVVAVGACSGVGVVWQLSAARATELYRGGTALVAAAITTDGHIIAAGPSGGVVFDGTTWTAEPHAVGASVAATTANDVWVGGGPDDIVHWDGSSWSRLGIEGASTPYVAATTREVYITGANEALLLR